MRAVKYHDHDYYQFYEGNMLFFDQINSRVKILSHQSINSHHLKSIKKLALENNMGKVISFSPESNYQLFNDEGFEVEGRITGFFKGQDALCCSFFVDEARRNSSPQDYMLPDLTLEKNDISSNQLFEIRDALEEDISQMTELFRTVFETYPSPVFDGEYIRSNMRRKKVIYKVALDHGKIIGIASAEININQLNAEMTDCVTSPSYRGHGILTAILLELENHLQTNGFICLYSLCRATIPAVNRAFNRQGYSYSGRMINNCHMCGAFEDMNIWVKLLA